MEISAPAVVTPKPPRRFGSVRSASQRATNSISEAYGTSAGASLNGSVRSSSPAMPYDTIAEQQASGSVTPTQSLAKGKKKDKVLRVEADRNRRSASAASNGPSTSALPAPAAGSAPSARVAKDQQQQMLIPPGMVYVDGVLRVAPGIQGALMPPQVPHSTSASLSHKMEDKGGSNNDYCEVCRGNGRFLCCDGCPRSFHFYCMNPPLQIDEMPPSNAAGLVPASRLSASKGSNAKGKGKANNQRATPDNAAEENLEEMWFCNVCVAERNPSAFKPGKGFGPFGPLIQQIQLDNPREFQLPAEIRTYFKGVATANDGTYTDANMLRQLKLTKQGFLEDRDPFRLKDKAGKAVLCFRCGSSALPLPSTGGGSTTSKASESAKVDAAVASGQTSVDPTIKEGKGWRKIVSCDFCALHWHIDCVDPPMVSMPHVSRKWMCPAHSDHVQPKRRVPRIGPAVPQTIDLPVPSASNIGPGRHYRTRVLNNGDIDIIPDPLDTFFGAEGVGRSLEKGWDGIAGVTDAYVTNSGGSVLTTKYRYRLPEKVIRTDFWNKVGGSDPARIGDIFYVAAQDIASGRHGARVSLASDRSEPLAGTRYRPFGQRDYPRSGLDSLADIAIARLLSDELAHTDHVDYVRPSRTRKLIETALQVEIPTNDEVPESSLRASLEEEEEDRKLAGDGADLDTVEAAGAVAATMTADPERRGDSARNKRKRDDKGADSDASSSLTDLSDDEDDSGTASTSVQQAKAVVPQTPRNAAPAASAGRMSTPRPGSAAPPATPGAASGGAKKRQRLDTGASSSIGSTSASASSSALLPSALSSSTGSGTRATTTSAADAAADAELRTAKHDAAVLRDQYEQQKREVEQLRAVQELMRIKGPGKLLEFLLAP
ncbi:uncharacterized protein PFL1_05814 [Pseudozyma flocculosa PF-1]|uniref:PHD-type domain-containing protein n=1 Tax=Pseudozyma flocculosa PF-1 TaxID=1277687 RepID=A0A061H1K2_9BASI|nr:uncharacterized protein PFL1_05814 [Pseudozyma flocculosa PF-1]EPQ26492.1 hypothetical protein PFL1_05814 [Pseudozyma flocculosa PF-1]